LRSSAQAFLDEDRYHLLPDVRRQWRGSHGVGLELAQRGHEVHFVSYAQPIRLMTPQPNIHYHEVEVSRYPLFEYPPYDLALATRMAKWQSFTIWTYCTSTTPFPIPSAHYSRVKMLAAAPRKRKLPFVTTLHGTDITLVGLDRSYLPLRAIRLSSDGVTAISKYLKDRTHSVFDIKNRIEVIYNFVTATCTLGIPKSRSNVSNTRANEKILVHLRTFARSSASHRCDRDF